MTAYIPKDYITRDDAKLESYRSIADIKNDQDLDRIQTWLDRYGPVPEEATNLLKIAHLKLAARSLGIEKIIAKITGLWESRMEYSFDAFGASSVTAS